MLETQRQKLDLGKQMERIIASFNFTICIAAILCMVLQALLDGA